MINYGNILVYISLIFGIFSFLSYLYEEIKKKKLQYKDIRVKEILVGIFAVSAALAYLLLLYYFYKPDFRFSYVWSFTSKYYPIYYRLSGSLAGQQGTLLYWAALIAIGSFWLARTKGKESTFVRRTQFVVILIALYFIFLVLLDSPFKTIYELQPNLPKNFIPENGRGLNPLLLDPFVATHPFTAFLGYAGTSIPAAAAIVYLVMMIRGRKDKEKENELHKMFVNKGLQWLRFAWLFSTISMIFGAMWAYRTLGWGGFWAWDPVENSMLIPWLMLTAAMHVAVEHKRDRLQYRVLAPVLSIFSFTFVLYATMVTRSGVFQSVHAFIAGAAGPWIIGITVIFFIIPLVLGAFAYINIESVEREEKGILNRTNLFYAAILVLLIITFIVVYGTTYPPIVKLITGKKYLVTRQFYSIWIYPFFLIMLLLVGLGLHYKPSMKKENIKTFAIFTALTIIAALIKPGDVFNIVKYSAIISAEVPFLYRMIGSASGLSVIPPVIYIIYASEERFKTTFRKLKKNHAKTRELGILAIHIGIALVAIGVVFTTLLTTEFTVTFNKNEIGKIKTGKPAWLFERIGGAWGTRLLQSNESAPYKVKLVDYRKYVDYGALGDQKNKEVADDSISIAKFYNSLASGDIRNTYTVHGKVGDVIKTEHIGYLNLVDGKEELWVAIDKSWDIPKGVNIKVTGMPMFGIKSSALNKTLDVIIFANEINEYKGEVELSKAYRRVQEAIIAVYDNDGRKLGEGAARLEFYSTGDARRPLIDPSLLPDGKDVYAVFDGESSGNLPITVRIKPFINWMWLGSVLFVIGIILTIVSNREIK